MSPFIEQAFKDIKAKEDKFNRASAILLDVDWNHLNREDYALISEALAYFRDGMSKEAYDMRRAIEAGDEYGNLSNHRDEHILLSCIGLMSSAICAVEEWMDFVADEDGIISLKDLSDEEKFRYRIQYSCIVRKLFLDGTSHSGGTSTRAKCRLLGFDPSDHVEFTFDDYEDDDEEEDEEEDEYAPDC